MFCTPHPLRWPRPLRKERLSRRRPTGSVKLELSPSLAIAPASIRQAPNMALPPVVAKGPALQRHGPQARIRIRGTKSATIIQENYLISL